MCLCCVTSVVTIDKDMKVWKYMRNVNGVIMSPTHRARINAYTNHVDTQVDLYADYAGLGTNRYASGFHCFKSEIDAASYLNNVIRRPFDRNVILDYIIPKGTVVTYGEEFGYTVIVTPVLINPRVPPTSTP